MFNYGIFNTPNGKVVPVDFAICTEHGFITQNETFVILALQFLWHVNTEFLIILLHKLFI